MTLPLFLLLLAAPLASARLGETPEQCIARYGEPSIVVDDGNTAYHKKNGLAITVDFRDGKAVEIDYSVDGILGKLTQEQINALLDLIGEGQKWEELKYGFNDRNAPTNGKHLMRSDKAIRAHWDYTHSSISFSTPAEIELRKKEYQREIDAEKSQRDKAAKTTVDGL